MHYKDIRTLKILEEIDKGHTPSQRDLANELNISLGLVNSFIKRMASKGYFKVVNIQKNRVKYLLTPKGVAEKTRLTYEYIKLSYQFYNNARQRLRDLYEELVDQGDCQLIFYGAGDLAEIAYVSTFGTLVEMVAIVDSYSKGKKFFDYVISDPVNLPTLSYDKILITSMDSIDLAYSNILNKGVPSHRIATIQ